MGIKDLFKGEQKILSSTNLSGSIRRGDISSVKYAKVHKENKDRFIPVVNFSSPENFVFYGSAEQYYDDAFALIQNRFPYDGAYAEREEWRGELTHFERYIFEEVYPRTTGFICLGNTYAPTGTKSTAGFVSSSAPEYIYIKGGPHTDPNKKDLRKLFPSNDGKANYFKEDGNKKWSNLTFDLSGSEGGASVEFWLRKKAFNAANTAEVIFDLWNGAASGSAGYARWTLYMKSANPEKIFLHAQSGSAYCDVEIDTGLATTLDDAWHHYAFTLKNHHVDNFLEVDFYRDGNIISKGKEQILGPGSPKGLNDVSGTLNATIGSLITAFSGEANSAKGYGKLSASLDEFRYWKTERTDRDIGRNWFTQVEGGANERSLTSSLGVYYKFNEGITGDSATDSTVLDYSGRLSNGTWVGYVTGSSLRQTGSAMVLSSVADSEYKDPILYKAHPDVNSEYTKLMDDAIYHDDTNPSGIYSSIPEWITTEDLDTNGQVLKKLTQLIAGYFDELQHLIRELPRIKEKSYRYLRGLPSGSAKALPFAGSLLEQSGFVSPEIFIDATILEQLMARDEKMEFSDTLYNIKNSIYQNIYNNLVHIYKSKGTEKAFRNLFRCFGIDHELLKINLYASDTTYEYKDNYRASSYKKTFVDFNAPDRHGSIVYQQTSSVNSNSVSYIEGFTGGQVGVPMTFEAEAIFPFKPLPSSKLYLHYEHITSSVFGVHTALNNQADLSWAGTDYNFAVLTVRDHQGSPNVRFALSSSLTSSLMLSDTYYDVYDGEKWNFAVRVKPSEYPLGTHAFGTTDQDYILELYGVQANSSVAQKEFTLGSPISNAMGTGFLKSKKRVFVGSDRVDTTGSQRFYSDAKVSSAAAWASYLSASVIQSHAFDPGSFGIDEPHKNAFLMNVEGTPVTDAEFVPRAKTLILHWDFSSVTGSGAPNFAGYGNFAVEDLSSGSSKPGYSGEFAPILEKQHTAIGDRFLTNDTGVVNTEFLSAAEKRLPEVLNSSDMVKILTQDDVQFTRDSRPANQLLAIEKSMYQTVSEDMINLFASVKDFNNLVGDPVNRYRQSYKEMENLRSLYFDKIGNTPDLEKFLEYYKWIDSSISKMAERLIPASANMSEGIKTMVEEYALGARSKYHTKFPTMEFKEKIPEASMRGIDELTYNWKFGHAPLPSPVPATVATATITTTGGPANNETFTLTDAAGLAVTFVIKTGVTTVDGTKDGDNVIIGVSGAVGSAAATGERIRDAINASDLAMTAVEEVGPLRITLTQQGTGAAGNTAIDMSGVTTVTATNFTGGEDRPINENENSLWWRDRSDRDRGNGRDKIRSVATSDNSGSWIPYKLADSNRTLYDGSTYAKRSLLKPYKIDLVKSRELHGGHNFHENKRIGISQTAFLDVDANHPIKLILNPFSSGSIITRDVWNPSEKKRLDAMVVGSSAGSGKSNHLMPFSLYSSSIDSGDFGGVEGEHVEITNMHHDGYGIRGEVPMQGPFTEVHVGGRQHRHVMMGTGSDDVRNREEGFRIKFNTTSTEHGVSHAEVIGGYDKLNPQSPAAPFMRDEYAKRPINIRNIKSGTPEYAQRLGDADAQLTKVDAQLRLGNYEKKYQILQTSGRSKNNSVFKNRRGLFDKVLTTRTNNDVVYNLADSNIISGTVDFERPQRTGSFSNKHVFVERFSSPGGPASMGDSHGGPGLDIIAGEFSVYNTMNYRNKLVRDALNRFERRHSIFGGLEVPKSGSTNYLYPTLDHGIQQNKFRTCVGVLTIGNAAFEDQDGDAITSATLNGNVFSIFDGAELHRFLIDRDTSHATGSNGAKVNMSFGSANAVPVTLVQLGTTTDPTGAAIGTTSNADNLALITERVFTALSSSLRDRMTVEWDNARKITMRAIAVSQDALPRFEDGFIVETTDDGGYPDKTTTHNIQVEGFYFSGSSRHWSIYQEANRGDSGNADSSVGDIKTARSVFLMEDAPDYPSNLASTQDRISYHKTHRNARILLRTTTANEFANGAVVRVYDNAVVQHMIPANDFQYAWITASHLPFDPSKLEEGRTLIPGGYAAPDGLYSCSVGEYPAISFVSASDFGSYTKKDLLLQNLNADGANTRMWGATRAAMSISGSSLEGFMFNDGNINKSWIPTDFVGLNTNVYEPISSSANTVGYPKFEISPSLIFDGDPRTRILQQSNYVNSLFVSGAATRTDVYWDKHANIFTWGKGKASGFGGNSTIVGATPAVPALVNSIILHRNGPYGYPTWKQVRGGDHPVARHHKKENIISIMAEPELKTFKSSFKDTATITFDAAPEVNAKITLISTDGTKVTYTAKSSETLASNEFNASNASSAAASLKACIEHESGHNGKILVTQSGVTLTLTQLAEAKSAVTKRGSWADIAISVFQPRTYTVKAKRTSKFDNYVEPAVTSKYFPMETSVITEEEDSPTTVIHTYGNNLGAFANTVLTNRATIGEPEEQTYDKIKELYLDGLVDAGSNPVQAFNYHLYKESVYPREINAYLKKTRGRENYTETHLSYSYGRTTDHLTFWKDDELQRVRLTSSDNPVGSYSGMPHEPIAETIYGRRLMALSASASGSYAPIPTLTTSGTGSADGAGGPASDSIFGYAGAGITPGMWAYTSSFWVPASTWDLDAAAPYAALVMPTGSRPLAEHVGTASMVPFYDDAAAMYTPAAGLATSSHDPDWLGAITIYVNNAGLSHNDDFTIKAQAGTTGASVTRTITFKTSGADGDDVNIADTPTAATIATRIAAAIIDTSAGTSLAGRVVTSVDDATVTIMPAYAGAVLGWTSKESIVIESLPTELKASHNLGVTGSDARRNPMQVVGSRKYPWWVSSSLGKYEALTALNGALCSEGRAVQEFYMAGPDDSLKYGADPWSRVGNEKANLNLDNGAIANDRQDAYYWENEKRQQLKAGLSFEFLQWVPNWTNHEGIQPFNSQSVSGDHGTREYDHYIPRYRTNELAGRNPWFNSYEDYLDDIRFIAKDHTILPEFRISEHIEHYTKRGIKRPNRSWLELPGGRINASSSAGNPADEYDSNIFKEYSHSDFMRFFGEITEDHEEVSDPVVIKLQMQGVKKLLPYKGFYPAQRTVQMAQLFSESFSVGIQEESGITALNQPLFGPGILFNSIKSGIACDWLAYTSSAPRFDKNWDGFVDNNDGITGNAHYRVTDDGATGKPFPKVNALMQGTRTQPIRSRHTEAGHYEPQASARRSKGTGGHGRGDDHTRVQTGTRSPDSGSAYMSLDLEPSIRLPFEALVDPARYLPKRKISPGDPDPEQLHQGMHYIPPMVPGLFFNNKYNQYPVTGSWTGKSDNRYAMAMNNFLAETAKFFLDGGTFTSFASSPEKDFELMVSGTSYYMDVVLRKTDDMVMYEGPENLNCWYPTRADCTNAHGWNGWKGPDAECPKSWNYNDYAYSWIWAERAIGDECTGSHVRAGGPYMFAPDFNSARGMHYGPSMRAFSASFLSEFTSASFVIKDGGGPQTDKWIMPTRWHRTGSSAGTKPSHSPGGAGAMAWPQETTTGSTDAARLWAVWSKNFTDPSFAPYTPPYFYGDSVARIKFTPHKHYPMSKGESAKFTLDEVLAGARKETFYINNNERAFKDLNLHVSGNVHWHASGSYNIKCTHYDQHQGGDIGGGNPVSHVNQDFVSRSGSAQIVQWLTASTYQEEFNGPINNEGSCSYLSTALARKHQMRLESSMNIFGKSSFKQVQYDPETGDPTRVSDPQDTSFDVWSMHTKWESPVLNFIDNETVMDFTGPGEKASLTITFADNPDNGDAMKLISTDGTAVTYTAGNFNTDGVVYFGTTGATAARYLSQSLAGTADSRVYDGANHAGKFTSEVTEYDDGTGKIIITQVVPGVDGNTAVTLTDDTAGDPFEDATSTWVFSGGSQGRRPTVENNFNRDLVGVATRGMWKGYGESPEGSSGIWLDLRESFPSRTKEESTSPSIATKDSTAAPSGSLIKALGFTAAQKRVGKIKESKIISEAIVAIPFYREAVCPDEPEAMRFFTLADDPTLSRALFNVAAGLSTAELNPGDSIIEMAERMENYVIPPHLDFSNDSTIEPFAMYIFPFTHQLSKKDLENIWQGIMPDISVTAEKGSSTISHNFGENEFFKGRQIPSDTRWMVFKVKQRAEISYDRVLRDTKDDTRYEFEFEAETGPGTEYSYNWPYDYFSLVELGRLDATVRIGGEPLEPARPPVVRPESNTFVKAVAARVEQAAQAAGIERAVRGLGGMGGLGGVRKAPGIPTKPAPISSPAAPSLELPGGLSTPATPIEKVVAKAAKVGTKKIPRALRTRSEKAYTKNKGASPKAAPAQPAKGIGAVGAGLPARQDRIEAAPRTVRKAARARPRRARAPKLDFKF